MSVNYNKLWKLLIDKGMKKKDLQAKSGVSAGIIAKLGKNEDVNTSTLTKICEALNCDISDIVELVPKNTEGDLHNESK